ncbi:helix-turn-helix domain-containing protein [Companilactobacillus allii]|uniref:Helix-turn-helix domain-containing protein n=1 Tax=Companilactobacillus allii TaxID=1847728 RepID=A0A1P8Q4B7_9LACO|nr:helix-turn-helix domain-containing protein [Companilactobacillus allii]APX72694.1 hypothetical protein BTM29_09090 [Companilactobacillus allii]USQ69801.1 helix-turn-helix domain-containing protein [Companilactobacillus allii]
MENEKPSYYSILTAEVRYDSEITYFEKILYSEITALSNKYGYCTATNNYFKSLYGKSIGTVSRSINHLKSRGFLTVEIIRNGKEIKSRKIYPIAKNVNTPITKNEYTPTQKTQKGIPKNRKGNNTSNNSTSNNNSHKSKDHDINDENYKLANYLMERIKANNPNIKEPNLQNWSDSIRLMHERDNRDYQNIKNMIDWSQSNDFWSTVILSAVKLRKQYDQMFAQMSKKKKIPHKSYDYDLPY